MNITQPIRHFAGITPDATAIIGDDDSIVSIAMLERSINRMAAIVGLLGLRAGDIVCVDIGGVQRVTALILTFALTRMGITTADPSFPSDRVRMRFRPGLSAEPGCVAFDASWLASAEPADNESVATIDADFDVVFRIFSSSGTTGLPKHIPISHALMVRRIDGWWGALGKQPATRMVGAGLNSVWAFAMVLRTLWLGGTLVLSETSKAAASLHRHKATSLMISPIALRSLLDGMPAGLGPLPALTMIETGGSVIPASLYNEASMRLCPNIHSVMGSTEADCFASAPLSVLLSRPGAVGFLWPDVEVEAIDTSGRPLPLGSEGILRIRSTRVAPGYLSVGNAPDGSFHDGWFHSGDIGSVSPDGMLILTGRVSELINAGGVKISPALIEEALMAIPTVTDVAAFAVQDTSGLDEIWAAVVASAPVEEDVLNAHCETKLGANAPVVILQLEAIPRNANGKIQRDELVRLAAQLNAAT